MPPDRRRAWPILAGATAAAGGGAVAGAVRRLNMRARRAASRTARLQAITAALSAAVDVEAVARVVVEQVCLELGGGRGTLSLLDEDTGTLRLVDTYGGRDLTQEWATYDVEAPLPSSEAVRRNELVIVRSLAERNLRFPSLAGRPPAYDHALVCAPLAIGERILGVASISFDQPRSFTPDERRFLEAIGAQCAQALDRAMLHAAERRRADRQHFLAQASAALSSSLDYETTLKTLADLIVPALADTVSIHVADEHDDLRLVDLRHIQPDGADAMWALSRRTGDVVQDETMLACFATGESFFYGSIPEGFWAERAEDAEQERLLSALDTNSGMVVAMTAGQSRLGTLAVTTCNASGRRLQSDDIAFVEDMARRAGAAIANARAHQLRVELADTLQQSLLPPALPIMPGVDLAAAYRAVGRGVVGGDFYDIVPIDAQRWVVVIGDVCGKGVEAASLTAQVRYTVRALAGQAGGTVARDPAALLVSVNEALAGSDFGERFATAVVAMVEATGRHLRVVVASAGHPPPVIRRRDGLVGEVGSPGLPLGLFPAVEYPSSSVEVEPGDVLVLYTDGVTEARTPQGAFAPDLLVDTLRNAGADSSAGRTIAAVLSAVDALEQGHRRDDIAVLALAPLDPGGRRHCEQQDGGILRGPGVVAPVGQDHLPDVEPRHRR